MPVLRKARNTASSLLPGYADLQEIGGGAFATVYKAVEVQTGRPVALKILKVDTIHAQLLETFNQEIQALAAVSDHPNIVTLYRPSSTIDGRPVLVLELCRESLGQQLRTKGPIDPAGVTLIGIKIAGALETAHRNGFLHRDMKPQNILITQFGEPALADFGVAALQASAQLTAGVFGFTTLHAAPEMLEGQHLSPATDIYGLASTMYQLLTGRAPFASYDNEAPASVILRILRDPVRPLRDEHIPLDLADLLEGALSKEPDRRPRSALDFAQLLQRIERAQGWPETSFVAWGQEGRQPTPGPPSRGPLGVAGTNGGSESPRSPSAGPGRRGRAPAATGEPLMSTPGIVTPSVEHGPSRRDPAGEGDRPTGPRPPSLPPLLPPAPPAPPVRPSLAPPDPGVRNVVMPPEAVQGRGAPVEPPTPPAEPGPPVPHQEESTPPPPTVAETTQGSFPPAPSHLAPPWAPVSPSGHEAAPVSAPASAPLAGPWPSYEPPPRLEPPVAPTFVDPDPSDRPDTSSVYEQTMGVHQLFERPDRPSTPAPPSAAPESVAGRLVAVPVWAAAGIVVAVLVVAAAILLLSGVI